MIPPLRRIGFVALASELLSLQPEGSSMIGAVLGLTARLLKSLMQLASSLCQDALFVPYGIGSKMRACIYRQEFGSAWNIDPMSGWIGVQVALPVARDADSARPRSDG